MQKLDRYGFRGKINWLLQSYLTNRKQCVISSGVSSSELNIRYGVPQGSVLGPLLFLLYINDLPDSIEHSKVTLYADDTVIFANSSNATAQEKLQKDLSDADDWCNRNKLTINTKKSEVILFGHQKTNLNLSLQNCRLETVSQFKYLEIMLDTKLNFESHINEVLKKLARFNGLMYRARDYFSKSSLLRPYQTYCKPIIMYGLLAYGSARLLNQK